MEAVNKITSRIAVLPQANIDTDQIIPARYLTTTTRDGLGEGLFSDWRYDENGQKNNEFILNAPDIAEFQILVAGTNFGCGSSREHAPWALLDFGFRAVVSNKLADIFRNNSIKNGLLPVVVDDKTHAWLLSNHGTEVTVDLEACVLTYGDGQTASFVVDAFARHCLMQGVDELGYLLSQSDDISTYEATR